MKLEEKTVEEKKVEKKKLEEKGSPQALTGHLVRFKEDTIHETHR